MRLGLAAGVSVCLCRVVVEAHRVLRAPVDEGSVDIGQDVAGREHGDVLVGTHRGQRGAGPIESGGKGGAELELGAVARVRERDVRECRNPATKRPPDRSLGAVPSCVAMGSRVAWLAEHRGRRGGGALSVAAEAAAELRKAANGEMQLLRAAERAQVVIHDGLVVARQDVIDASGSDQAAKVAKAGLEAEGEEKASLVGGVHTGGVSGRSVRIGEEEAIENG